MPSPAGHALGGLLCGWIVRGNRTGRSPGGSREALTFAALGALADIDLLFGMHSGPTHGIGVALLAGALAWTSWLPAADRARPALALACVLAYASHTLLDWLGTDTSAPVGIMALWPFSTAYYESGLHVFMAVSRRFRQPEVFWAQNIQALLRELVILGPAVLVMGWVRRSGESAS
jgi:inner membrane protein